MSKSANKKSLTLTTETLRVLDTGALDHVQGGFPPGTGGGFTLPPNTVITGCKLPETLDQPPKNKPAE